MELNINHKMVYEFNVVIRDSMLILDLESRDEKKERKFQTILSTLPKEFKKEFKDVFDLY